MDAARRAIENDGEDPGAAFNAANFPDADDTFQALVMTHPASRVVDQLEGMPAERLAYLLLVAMWHHRKMDEQLKNLVREWTPPPE